MKSLILTYDLKFSHIMSNNKTPDFTLLRRKIHFSCKGRTVQTARRECDILTKKRALFKKGRKETAAAVSIFFCVWPAKFLIICRGPCIKHEGRESRGTITHPFAFRPFGKTPRERASAGTSSRGLAR